MKNLLHPHPHVPVQDENFSIDGKVHQPIPHLIKPRRHDHAPAAPQSYRHARPHVADVDAPGGERGRDGEGGMGKHGLFLLRNASDEPFVRRDREIAPTLFAENASGANVLTATRERGNLDTFGNVVGFRDGGGDDKANGSLDRDTHGFLSWDGEGGKARGHLDFFTFFNGSNESYFATYSFTAAAIRALIAIFAPVICWTESLMRDSRSKVSWSKRTVIGSVYGLDPSRLVITAIVTAGDSRQYSLAEVPYIAYYDALYSQSTQVQKYSGFPIPNER